MGQIPDSVIEEILSKADIESVVGRYVTFTKRTGQNLFGLCPFHSEKTPSFSVSLSKGIYHCFGCQKGGNAISFIMEAEKLSYPEAIRFLGQQYGVEVPEFSTGRSNDELKRKKERVSALLNDAASFYSSCLKGADGKAGRDYARKRQLSDETVAEFGIGYAPEGWDRLYNHLLSKGYSEDEMKGSGLFTVSSKTGKLIDLFRGRLVFPICDVFGKTIAFGGRNLGPELPKYVNSPDSLVYKKQDHLYALNVAKKAKDNRLIIVEGYMDAIAMHQAGVKNAVASLGTSFTDSQLRLASRYADEVIFFFDSDKAGKNAAIRAIKMMLRFQKKMSGMRIMIKIACVPDGKDPDEYIKINGKESFYNVVKNAKDVDDYLFDRAYDDNCDDTGKLDTYRFQEDIIMYGSWLFDDLKREKLASSSAQYLGANYETILKRMEDHALQDEGKARQNEMREAERARENDVRSRQEEQNEADNTAAAKPVSEIRDDLVFAQELKVFVYAVRLKDLLFKDVDEEDRIKVSDFYGKNMKRIVSFFLERSDSSYGIQESFLLNELQMTVLNGKPAEEVYLNAADMFERKSASDKARVDEYLMALYALRKKKLDNLEKSLVSKLAYVSGDEKNEVTSKLRKISEWRDRILAKEEKI
ncbi:MAG: DNA primase [Clostridiales bacterium]|nr:DNA primase [Clostridiales bacterium]